MKKINCWEYKKCGKYENKDCPSIKNQELSGINGGNAAGRVCWFVAGTFCGDGEPQGTFAQKYHSCLDCDFYKLVKAEEGDSFIFKMF